MPVMVACRCGQQFQAQDHLAGQVVRCPSCGQPLQIPLAQPTASAPAAGDEFWDSLQSPAPSMAGPTQAQEPAQRPSGYNAPMTLGIQCQKCGYQGQSFQGRVGFRWWTTPLLLLMALTGIGVVPAVIILGVLRRQRYDACPNCRGRKFSRWQGQMTPENAQILREAPAKDRMYFMVNGLITLGGILLALAAALIFMFSQMN